MTPFSQFALLDAVVAGCKWRTCPASNSGTQPIVLPQVVAVQVDLESRRRLAPLTGAAGQVVAVQVKGRGMPPRLLVPDDLQRNVVEIRHLIARPIGRAPQLDLAAGWTDGLWDL